MKIPKVKLKTRVDKTVAQGDDNLVSRSKWIPPSDINTERKIIQNPLFDEVFEKINKDHNPEHRTAFLSLCTSSRPYDSSRKWGTFVKTLPDVDFIVVSNGGIIPQKYWQEYPFLNYDGPGTDTMTPWYIMKMEQRVDSFFRENSYDYVVSNFGPLSRNRNPMRLVLEALKKEGVIKDFIITPDTKLYRTRKRIGFDGGLMVPDLDSVLYEDLLKQVKDLVNS